MNKLDEKLLNDLGKISTKHDALLMSFVAPDKIVRTSPVAFDYASISIKDFYTIEDKVESLREKGVLPSKLHLIIQTPGGLLGVSTKIAKYLRYSFKEIIAFIPYEAASGGTMMCLAANSIVMGSTSNLTPIDPQVIYNGQRVAATTYDQAINDFKSKFDKFRPDELPNPYQQLANHFDPIIAKEMDKTVLDTIEVAYDLLTKSQNPPDEQSKNQLINIAFNLGKNARPHSHIIDIDEAKSIGLNINSDSDTVSLLKTYKKWVGCMLTEEVTNHIIETIIPTKKDEKPNQAVGSK
ncbi:MAG: hypothetical protein WBO77_03965 [Microgenomates group bacterium]